MSESDEELLSLIDLGSFYQAEKIVQLKLRKYPNRSFYVAAYNEILHGRGKTEEALEKNLGLLKQIPSDIEALNLLHRYFYRIGRDKDGNAAFENAIKKYPSESLVLSWFKISLDMHDSRLLQKICMILQRQVKDNRSYTLWCIYTCCALIGEVNDEKEENLFRNIALKLVESIRPLRDDQELYLYLELLRYSEKFQEIIDEIENFSNHNGMTLELQLAYSDQLKALGNWDKLFGFSKELLFVKKLDDLDTWKQLIVSGKHLNKSFNELKGLISAKSATRNSRLAAIELALAFGEDTHQAVSEYYTSMKTKLACFNDLNSYKEQLKVNDIIKPMTESTENDTFSLLIAVTNEQKFAFLNINDQNQYQLIKKNWDIYKKYEGVLKSKPEFDSYPANELVLMNIDLKLKAENSLKAALESSIILRKVLSKDPNDPKVRLWLLKLYNYFAFPSVSMNDYDKLKIKMIQHDTLGHYLNVEPTVTGLNYLLKMFRFYLTTEHETFDGLLRGYESCVFSKLDGFNAFGKRIKYSLAKFELIIEIIKISKITKSTQYVAYFLKYVKTFQSQLLNDALDFSDNRDYKTVWKFGINKSSNYEIDDPQHSKDFIKLALMKELILTEDDKTSLVKLFKAYNKLLSTPSLMEQLTPFENWLFKIYTNLFKTTKLEATKEQESINNYLNKNFRLSKIQNLLITDDPLSKNCLKNLSYTVALLRDINGLVHKQNFENVKNLRDQFTKDLRFLDFKSIQTQHLKQFKKSLNFDDIDFVDLNHINDSFELFEESLNLGLKVLSFI